METIREIRVTRPYLILRPDDLLLARRGDLLAVDHRPLHGTISVSPSEALQMLRERFAEIPAADLEDSDV